MRDSSTSSLKALPFIQKVFLVSTGILIVAILIDIQFILAFLSETRNPMREEYLEGAALTAVISWPAALIDFALAIFGGRQGFSVAQRCFASGLVFLWLVLSLSGDFLH